MYIMKGRDLSCYCYYFGVILCLYMVEHLFHKIECTIFTEYMLKCSFDGSFP